MMLQGPYALRTVTGMLIQPSLSTAGTGLFRGDSTNAILRPTGTGQLGFGASGTSAANCTFKTLTLDASALNSSGVVPGFRFSNAQNFIFKDNRLIGHPAGSVPGTYFEGGYNVLIFNNNVITGAIGGATLQIQTLGGTPDSEFLISRNYFDSCGLWRGQARIIVEVDARTTHSSVTSRRMDKRRLPNRNIATMPMKWSLLLRRQPEQPLRCCALKMPRNPIMTGNVAVLR